jgi:thiol-disulfide isomerase/thioredoxin
MKHLYITLISIIVGFNASAQPEEAEFPNWTHTDINGVEYTLYDFLDAGKIVIIDIFTTWCPNCVNSLPALEEIWEAHGPNGDDTMMIFSFERDATTNNEVSWAAQHNVENPVFSDALATMATWNTFYQPNYFVICPDRTHHLVVGAINSNSAPLLNLADDCGTATSIEEAAQLEVIMGANPVGENLNFQIAGTRASWQIMSLSGQVVASGTTIGRVDVDTSQLPDGLYLLQVLGNTDVLTRKFIKRR